MPPSGKQVVKTLQAQGFTVARQSGSHVVMQKQTDSGTVTTVVPQHKELKPGTLSDISKQAGIPKGTLAGGNGSNGSSSTSTAGTQAAAPNSSTTKANSSLATSGKTINEKDLPLNQDIPGIKTQVTTASDVLGSGAKDKLSLSPDINTKSKLDTTPDVNVAGSGAEVGMATDVLGSGSLEPGRNLLSATESAAPNPVPVSADASEDLSDASSGGPMTAPSPYTAGAPITNVTENDSTGVTQTTTATGAVIDQSADGTPYRAGWVDPNDPSQPIVTSNPADPNQNPYTAVTADSNMVSDAASGGGYPVQTPDVPASTSTGDDLNDVPSTTNFAAAPAPTADSSAGTTANDVNDLPTVAAPSTDSSSSPSPTDTTNMISDAAMSADPSESSVSAPIPVSSSAANDLSDASSGGFSAPAAASPDDPSQTITANDPNSAPQPTVVYDPNADAGGGDSSYDTNGYYSLAPNPSAQNQ